MKQIFALAIAASAGLLIPACEREKPSAISEFRSAYASARQRPVTLRIASFPYGAPPRVARGSESSSPLRIAALAVLASPDAAAATEIDARTAALLVSGDVLQAMRVLQREVARSPNQPSMWNDYAVALYETAVRVGAPENLAEALAATDRAIAISPSSREAVWNRAAILEALQLRDAAIEAWRRCLELETIPAWRDEARAHFAALSVPTARERWKRGEALRTAMTLGHTAEGEAIVREFRQESRTWAESQVLSEWADLWLADKRDEAAKTLTIARDVGAILDKLSGERLLRDAVAAIDRAVQQGSADELAQAHVDYRTARMAIAKRVVSEAIAPMLVAEKGFARAGSPMLLVARYWRAAATFDATNDAGAALKLLEETIDPSYRALSAHFLWERSRIVGRTGDLYQSLDLSRHALEIFDRLDERAFAARMRMSIATSLSLLGRRRESWQSRQEIFRVLGDRAGADDLERALNTLALSEVADRRLDGAAALLQVQLSSPSVLPLLHFEASLWRSFLGIRDGERAAESQLVVLRSNVERVPDAGQRDNARDDLRFAEALLDVERDPARAVTLLSDTIAWREAAKQTAELPEAYVQRAAAESNLKDEPAAQRDLGAALELLERRRLDIHDVELRDTFFDSAKKACGELLRLHAGRGEDVAAFEVAERCRARGLVDTLSFSGSVPEALTEAEVRRALPVHGVLLHYSTLADETLLFVLKRNSLRMVSLKAGAETIRRAVAAKTALLPQLYDALLAPVAEDLHGADTVIIVPDETTAGVPFAALPDETTGRPLVQSCRVVSTPSASYYARAARESRAGIRGDLLVAGDPAFDTSLFVQPRLPAAAEEARAIAALYRFPVILTGSDATTDRLLDALPGCDIAHIATHALISDRDSSLSVLLTAKTPATPGVLYPTQISSLHLTRAPIVILAGCRTAATGPGRGSIRGFANSFLSAGSRAVIATLWEIDDHDAMTFSRALHGRLRTGQDAATALRETQLEMLTSPNPELRRPELWGAFQLYGSP